MRPISSSPRNSRRRVERHLRRAIARDRDLQKLYSIPEIKRRSEFISSLLKKYYDFGQIEAYLETRDILRERTIPYRIDPKMTLITERLEPISDYNKYLLMKVQLLLDYEKYIVELALKSIK